MDGRTDRLIAGAVAGVAVLCLVSERMAARLLPEDGPVETLSALLYLAAAVIALAGTGGRRWLRRGVAGLALLCFLSEISFGARLFGYAMPAMPGGGELDGGQDLAMLLWRQARPWLSAHKAAVLAAAVLGAGLAGLLLWRLWPLLRAVARPLADRPAERRAVIAVALLALAVLIDLDIRPYLVLRRLEEVLELAAAGFLLAAVLAHGWQPAFRFRRPAVARGLRRP
ncbi:hypothetical protein [Rhodocista pekingensis]|uniref:Uncharacterized protein n=1 Tax=Rhodocista pekingensis TaxID=201185 RepID=A0ABW2KVM9_9PROT